jgi:hypothetical protein
MYRILAATCLCLSSFVIGYGQQPEGPLTNVAVVKLVKAGFKEKTIITIINSRPGEFKLDTDGLIELKRNGVNDNVILAMLSSQTGNVFVEDEWSGGPFSKEIKKTGSGDSQDQGSSQNIFGSGSTSRSSSQTKGSLGGNRNDGTVSGSATVRILKPAESGGATAPKLEKMPTLNNEGVIRLVEAGFTEGTIIKRIEDSPVDFDLSPGKLDELYKRRVTDAIVVAMKTAMGK